MNSRRFSLPFGAQALYSLRAVFADLYQRKFATLITVLVIAVSLTIPTVSYLLWKNIHHATTQFYPESELTVYLHKNMVSGACGDFLYAADGSCRFLGDRQQYSC